MLFYCCVGAAVVLEAKKKDLSGKRPVVWDDVWTFVHKKIERDNNKEPAKSKEELCVSE